MRKDEKEVVQYQLDDEKEILKKLKKIYQDKKGEWHTTTGKPPVRMLHNAFNTKKNVAKKIIEKEISDAMNKK